MDVCGIGFIGCIVINDGGDFDYRRFIGYGFGFFNSFGDCC